jgi:metallo-beta-lactamase family protein
MTHISLISHGAAREVTGTCHELKIGDKSILLDCGLFQGKREESMQKNKEMTFDAKNGIDAVILSHGHMDHAGRIPLLYKNGFQGPIFCTPATKDLSEAMLLDSAFIQERDEEFMKKHYPEKMVDTGGPLYTQADATECMSLFVGKEYHAPFEVIEGVHCEFFEAGHILGSAMMVLTIDRLGQSALKIGFSGDIGRNTLPIIRDPEALPQVDYLLCESTYGNRAHEDIASARGKLRDVILETAARGGKVLIPAFSLERTQEIVYDLHVLWDAKEIPAIPIIIDSPLSSKVTAIFEKYTSLFDEEMFDKFINKSHDPFHFSLVNYTETLDESKALNGRPGPFILMASSGMCEAGRIRHHLKNELADHRNSIIAVGFMADNTLGRRLLDPEITEVQIFGERIPKRANIVYINAYSGHADKNDLDQYINHQKHLKGLYLVHGEEQGMFALAERTATTLKHCVITMPERGTEYTIEG